MSNWVANYKPCRSGMGLSIVRYKSGKNPIVMKNSGKKSKNWLQR